MRIAYLSTFYPFRGGINHFNTSLLKALSLENEVQAFTFKRQYPDILFPGKSQYVSPNDQVEKVYAPQILDTINPFSYFTSANTIRAFRPDVLLMKYWMPFFAPSLGTVAGKIKKTGCKVISILDNVVPHEKKFYDIPFSRYFLKRNNGFIVMSETVKNDLLTLQPSAPYLFHEHPLYDHFGKKTDRGTACQKLGIRPDQKILLFFGFIRDYKGLDVLIKSMKLLPEEYFLVIAGEVYGEDKKYIDLIRQEGLSERIQANLRYIRDDEVAYFFGAADLNVLPYRSATQSGILSIAWHFEVPALVTDSGSLRDAVESFGTGVVVEKAEPELIATGIQEIFRENRLQIIQGNIRNLKQKLSWKSLATAITEFANRL